MNSDPEVMRYVPARLSHEQSDAFVDGIEAHWLEHGYGLWAVEIRGAVPFAGYVGLWKRDFAAHFTPAVEIGWRLARAYWRRGYATEAARAALADGFSRVGLKEIVSFTIPLNLPSIRVMEKIGMSRDLGGDFDHPNLPVGHPYRRHVLYRIAAP